MFSSFLYCSYELFTVYFIKNINVFGSGVETEKPGDTEVHLLYLFSLYPSVTGQSKQTSSVEVYPHGLT